MPCVRHGMVLSVLHTAFTATQSPGFSQVAELVELRERAAVHAGQAGVRGGQFQAALLSLGALHLRSGHTSLALGALQVLSSSSPPSSWLQLVPTC